MFVSFINEIIVCARAGPHREIVKKNVYSAEMCNVQHFRSTRPRRDAEQSVENHN